MPDNKSSLSNFRVIGEVALSLEVGQMLMGD